MYMIKTIIMRMTENLKTQPLPPLPPPPPQQQTRIEHNTTRSVDPQHLLHYPRKGGKNRQEQPNNETWYRISPLRTASGKVKILRQQSLSLHAGITRCVCVCVCVCGAVWWCNSAVMRIGGEGQERTVIKGRNRKSPREIRVLFERQFMLRWTLIQGVAALGRDRMTF